MPCCLGDPWGRSSGGGRGDRYSRCNFTEIRCNFYFAFHFSKNVSTWCQSFSHCLNLRACIIEESILLKSERQSWFHRTLLPACLILFFAGTASSICSSFLSGTSSEACISIRLSSVNSSGAVAISSWNFSKIHFLTPFPYLFVWFCFAISIISFMISLIESFSNQWNHGQYLDTVSPIGIYCVWFDDFLGFFYNDGIFNDIMLPNFHDVLFDKVLFLALEIISI